MRQTTRHHKPPAAFIQPIITLSNSTTAPSSARQRVERAKLYNATPHPVASTSQPQQQQQQQQQQPSELTDGVFGQSQTEIEGEKERSARGQLVYTHTHTLWYYVSLGHWQPSLCL